MKSNIVLKRIVAYMIDALIVMLLSSLLTRMSFLNPKYDEYLEVADKQSEIMLDYYNQEINIQEYNERMNDLSYDVSKSGYVYIIGDIVIAFLYFGVFACITKGQTLGKRIMNIKIVSNKNKDLKLYNYLIRTFILNGIILNIFTLVAICFKESTFLSIYTVGTKIDSILLILNLLMICFYKEGRGLHDILAGTKVIDVKALNEVAEEPKKEVEVIAPVKQEKETKKKTATTKTAKTKKVKKEE